MHKMPIFRVQASGERRPPLAAEEPTKQRVIQEKLCPCCGNFGKKHTCPHSKCEKPCKIMEKKRKISTKKGGEEREKTQSVNQNEPEPEADE